MSTRTTARTTTFVMRRRRRIPSQLLLSVLLLQHLKPALVQAHVSCSNDTICEELLRVGSKCDIDAGGICTNPFVSGCLQNYLADNDRYKNKIRTCNSEDDDGGDGVCTPSILDYPELRILSQNWESATFTSWIYQIILSELLNVPVTIESSGPGRNANFYDKLNSFDYGLLGYDYDALETALELKGDCRKLKTAERSAAAAAAAAGTGDDDTYQSCGHMIPEVWNGQASAWRVVEQKGIIEPPSGSGAVGRLGWFIPRYLAEQDDTLLEFLGVQGQKNREKVANTFLRPTTWGDYCNEVAPEFGGCEDSDVDVVSRGNTTTTLAASRAPQDDSEAGKYFVDGLYTGHFRYTDQNNCTKNPLTCTGHIVDIPCDWSTHATAQAYWQDIPVESNGPLAPNGAYDYASQLAIYAAANATRSAVLYYWWLPDAMYQDYLGTDYEMLTVQLSPPSQDCVSSRVKTEQRCSASFEDRIGNEIGGCDGEAHSLTKLIVHNLLQLTIEQDEATRSPGYDFLRGASISELQVGKILTYWSSRKVDKWNYDPRDAVCRWVAENIDYLEIFLPRTYPRVVEERDLYPVWRVALAIAGAVTALTVATGVGVYTLSKHPAMRYAQLPFLNMVLAGLFMTSTGTLVLTGASPSMVSCTAGTWLVVVGYSLSVVPLMVKVGTVNRLLSVSNSFRRVKVKRGRLYAMVSAMTALVIAGLLVWTIIDPVTNRQELNLTNEQTGNGETIVELSTFCSSESKLWYFLSVCWQLLLLLCSSVLAFQNRSVRQEFNEASTLAFMIYSHLIFSILLLVLLVLDDSYSSQMLSGFRYLLYGCDTLATLVIYFAPKFLNVFEKDHLPDFGRLAMLPRATFVLTGSSLFRRSDSAARDAAGQVTNSDQTTSNPAIVSEESPPVAVSVEAPAAPVNDEKPQVGFANDHN